MDLTTTYMGLKLKNPLVVAAGPLSQDIGRIRQMEDCGASAVVLWSLFEEQIEHEAAELDYYLQHGSERFAESLSYFPAAGEYRAGPDEYLEHIRQAKKAVGIPVIGSLNGVSARGWASYASLMQQAGADAIELNVYYIPTDPNLPSEHVEKVYTWVYQTVKEGVSIPAAIKLSPFFSSTANMLLRLDRAGVDGMVLFNRFYQPDIDIEELQVTPNLQLSTPFEGRLALRWIAIMFGKIKASLAATTGIYSPQDVVKTLLAGADVTMLCSTLLENGISHLTTLTKGLAEYLERKGYESVGAIKGILSQKNCPEPSAFERANYMKALTGRGMTEKLV
ncbi:MAG: dihydroorotate dehydrogenase-like protein [Planctomycetes bacterium]|nr:dihydroorotate dehydrogenase-like protein [Planctomycetota bacterium]